MSDVKILFENYFSDEEKEIINLNLDNIIYNLEEPLHDGENFVDVSNYVKRTAHIILEKN